MKAWNPTMFWNLRLWIGVTMPTASASVWKSMEPVIPPINTRAKKIAYDKELYRERNRVERFFNKA